MLVATAGHVDHGKTSLVKCLTGVNTDRLQEEQRRGMSIVLGFAYRRTNAGHSIGFIDVPGHRRFINAMISGISGVDLGMLVVDANEGLMPQTLEHVEVMRLLGIEAYLAVVTKIDRAPPDRTAATLEAVQELLPGCRICAVSNITGEGIALLQSTLDELAASHPGRSTRGYFRMSIDRAFALKGTGLVVTGTVASGQVQIGDSLRLLNARFPDTGVKVRVRSIHAQDEPTARGLAGQRCALNISGDLDLEDIRAGDRLSHPECAPPSLRFDAQLRVRPDAHHRLKHLQPVKLYIGAKRLQAKVYFLDGPAGKEMPQEVISTTQGLRLVQFILKEPVQACIGDRFLIQDDSENVILGGGVVLSPNAPQWRKQLAHRIDFLKAMAHLQQPEILEQLLDRHGQIVDFRELQVAFNLSDSEGDELVESMVTAGTVVRLKLDTGDWLLPKRHWHDLGERMASVVAEWHSAHPLETGIKLDTLYRAVDAHVAKPLLAALLAQLIRERGVTLSGGIVSSAGYRAVLSPQVQDAWNRLSLFLFQGGFQIPLLSEIEKELRLGKKLLSVVIRSALDAGDLHQISPKRVALPQTLDQVAERIQGLAKQQGSFSVIDAKSHLGLGRDLTIEILEYFDSIQLTKRQGNSRSVLNRAGLGGVVEMRV